MADYIVSSGVTSTGVVLSYWSSMNVLSGGTANSTTVNDYGRMYVSSGGAAKNTTVNGGYLYVYSGGTATNVVWTPCVGEVFAYDGAVVTYTSSYSGVYFGSDHVLLSSATVMSGKILSEYSCYMYVMSGGTANNTAVYAEAEMYVSSGGVANGTTIDYYGIRRRYHQRVDRNKRSYDVGLSHTLRCHCLRPGISE